MRSTMKISTNTALNNIMDNYSKMLKVQNQMSTGRRVNNPSDDPLAANAGMRLDTVLSRIEQYNRNIDVSGSFMSLSDSAMQSISDMANSAKSITIGAASDTTSSEMRQANSVEVQNMLSELVMLGNRNDGSRFIFGGTQTQNPPFEIVGSRWVHYNGNDNNINIQTDTASFMAMNSTGHDVFGSMVNTVETDDISADINMNIDQSTRLEDLNMGEGVPDGSIKVVYQAFPSPGIIIDLSRADTLEDVKDIIEETTATANAAQVTPSAWELRVEINDNHDGIRIVEFDASGLEPALVQAMRVEEVSNNTVAQKLGILGTSTIAAGPNESRLEGVDINPKMTDRTLLADLRDFTDSPISIINGSEPGYFAMDELNDSNNDIAKWNLAGLTENVNTDTNGQIYARLTDLAGGTRQVELFSGKERTPSQLVANGSTTSGGTVVLQEQNNSGITGTMAVTPPLATPGSVIDIDTRITFDQAFRATISVPAFEESNDANNVLSQYRIRGLELGLDSDTDGIITAADRGNTDLSGNLFVTTDDDGAGTYRIQMYRDAARTELVAQGQMTVPVPIPANQIVEGDIQITGEPNYAEVTGSVHMRWDTAVTPPAVTALNSEVQATFATVGDLINEIELSNTYTSAKVSDNGKGLEITSHLAGAYLSIGRTVEDIQLSNDNATTQPQFGSFQLSGVMEGTNTGPSGELYFDVNQTGPGASDGTIDIYKDAAMTEKVASGVVSGRGFVSISQEESSGLSGRIFFNDVGGALTSDNDIQATINQFRVDGDDGGTWGLQQLNELTLSGVIPGQNSDTNGQLYADISAMGQIDLYSDAAMTNMVATGQADVSTGQVIFSDVNSSRISGSLSISQYSAVQNDVGAQMSQFTMQGVVPGVNSEAITGALYVDIDAGGGALNVYSDAARTVQVATGVLPPPASGQVLLAPFGGSGLSGSVTLPVAPVDDIGNIVVTRALADNSVTLNTSKGLQVSGQEREENIFSTFNDVIDSLLSDDAGRLHELIGNFKDDQDRTLLARADLGSRMDRLNLLTNRHEDELVNFTKIRSDRIDLDYSKAVVEFQSVQNVFEASLRVTGQLIPMSLVDFI